MKRFYTKQLLTTIVALLCSIAASAHDFEVDGIFYSITSSSSSNLKVQITYKGSSYNAFSNEYSGSVVIPESVTYNEKTYSVTSIGEYTFYGCSSLTSVTIPNSVTSIGNDAFYGCRGLTSVTIPNSVTSIGNDAFYGCKGLTSITIPNSVTSIGNDAFYGCKGLTSITIPNSVTSIGEYTFYGCSGLTSVTIPNSVTSIGEYTFKDCSGLTSVTIPNSVTSIGNDAFNGCSGLTSVTIPNSVTSIGSYAFYRCSNLKTVINYSSLTISKGSTNNGYAGYYADKVINAPNGSIEGDFIFGKLDDVNTLIGYIGNDTELTLPANYKGENYVIGSSVFEGCNELTNVAIPNSVTSIGSDAFSGCSGLTNITIGNSVRSIGASAFRNCSGLTSIEIPNSVRSIGANAFYNCNSLTSVEIGNSITKIEPEAFSRCNKLNEVLISDLAVWCNIEFSSGAANPLSYGKNLYLNEKLVQDLVIPEGVENIKKYAFCNCSGLTSITIPNSITSIGDYAFSDCSGLTSITIPNSITSIGDYAFSDCSNLKTVINYSSLTISKGSTNNGYAGYYADKVINAPNGSFEGDFIFGKHYGVNTLIEYIGKDTILTLPASYKGENYAIGDNVFNDCTSLTSITIPNSVTSIGNSAFYGCTSLKNLCIEDGETTLRLGYNNYSSYNSEKGLFYNCPLETLYLGRNINYQYNSSYGYSPFYNKKELKSVTIGNSVTNIGKYAFANCSGLTSITIPNSITSIGDYAFSDCSNLKTVINYSSLTISKGSTNNGYAGYYADKVINAPNGSIEGDFAFAKIDGVNTLCGYIGNDTELTLPANYKDYVIGEYAFADCSSLTSVTIPNSVTSIGNRAFEGCKGLTSITIPNSVTSIGNDAFEGCKGLTSITIPNSVTSIGEYTFYGCSSLTSVTIGNSVTSIGNSAFYGCKGLTSVEIPNSVTSIGASAFKDCSSLISVEIPNSVTNIGKYTFYGCSGLTSVTIGNSVTNIGEYTFYGCSSLTSITIPNSVTSIGNSAFEGCSGITSVTIPNSVTSIGEIAFSGCSGLTSVEIPNSVTSIRGFAFYGCSNLKTVINYSSLTISKESTNNGYVGYYADKVINAPNGSIEGDFVFAKIYGVINTLIEYLGNDTVLTLPANYKGENYIIGDSAFYDCSNLKTVINYSSLTISKGSTNNGYAGYYADKVINAPNGSIEGDFAFAKIDGVNTLCGYIGNDTELTLPANYKDYVIGEYAFADCSSLTSVTIPNSVTSIGNRAFYGCSGITSVTIGNSVTSIGEYAFYGCKGLTSVTIPNSVTNIGEYAFYGCKGLTSITIPNSVTSIGESAFSGCSGLTSVEIPNSVTNIGYKAFSGCSGLTSITIGNSVTNIGEYTFYGCSSLTSVEIPNSVTNIGYKAFSGCSGLTSITIGNSVTNIGEYTFYGCSSLTSVTIPNSVTNIGNDAFSGCSGLTSITIGNSVTNIGYKAFYGCSSLTSVTIPNSVTSIGESAFSGCSGLTSITIGNSVTNIGEYAFYGCKGLTSITIPNSVTSIGESAFSGCSGLTSVEIPNSVTSIRGFAFYGCSNLKTVINYSSLTISKGSTNNGYAGYYADKVINAPNGSIEGDFAFAKIDGVNTLCGYIGNDTELTLPANYKGENYVIGNNAFYKCTGLTSIEIPNSVTSIGEYAFKDCSNLKTVINYSSLTISKESTNNGYAGYYADKVINAPNGSIEGDFVFAKIDGVNTLIEYLGNDTVLTLPANYNGENYVIGNNAFYKCTDLTSVTIPNSVTSIGGLAFYGCSGLTSVTIPNSVTSIGSRAFYDCSGLTSVEIPNSVTSIGYEAFYGCSVKTVINYSSLKISKGSTNNGYVGYYADKVINAPNGFIEGDFIWAKIDGVNTLAAYLGNDTELTLPANYNGENYVIGSDAFFGCHGLTSVEIPNSVTSIGKGAFYGCSVKTVINYSSLKISKGSTNNGYVGYYADKVINAPNGFIEGDFIWAKIDGVNTLAAYLGNDTELTLPANYKDYVIGEYAFADCSGLTSVTIPNSVTSIGEYAFNACNNLKTVINYSSLRISKRSTNNGYAGYYADKVINAPNGSFEGDFAFAKIDGVNTLCGYIGNDTELTLPANYKDYVIGEYAFADCSGLTSVTIPNSVTSIGNDAFNGCSGLKSVTFNCKRVGNFFGNNSNISEIVLGDNVVGILENALGGYSGLKSIKCTSAQPPKVGGGNFTSSHYQNVVLYVPKGSLATYQAADVWKEFWEIEEFETTGVEVVEDDTLAFEITSGGIQLTAADGKAVVVYSMNGALIEKIDCYNGEEITLDKGVYIISVGNKSVKMKL